MAELLQIAAHAASLEVSDGAHEAARGLKMVRSVPLVHLLQLVGLDRFAQLVVATQLRTATARSAIAEGRSGARAGRSAGGAVV